MPFDCRDPCFRNFDSTIFIDVIRMKSYVETKLGHAMLTNTFYKVLLKYIKILKYDLLTIVKCELY